MKAIQLSHGHAASGERFKLIIARAAIMRMLTEDVRVAMLNLIFGFAFAFLMSRLARLSSKEFLQPGAQLVQVIAELFDGGVGGCLVLLKPRWRLTGIIVVAGRHVIMHRDVRHKVFLSGYRVSGQVHR